PALLEDGSRARPPVERLQDDYWLEYYRPSTLSFFASMFPYKMNSTIKYLPFRDTGDGKYDLSPFRARSAAYIEDAEKWKPKKGVTIVTPDDSQAKTDQDDSSSLQSIVVKKTSGDAD